METDMRAHLRLVGTGGILAYRALFNWATPPLFIGTLLAEPVTQLVFFVYLGRQLGVADDRFFIIGNAVLAASKAGVYGGTMAVGNERRFGTLGNILLSPRSRTVLFLGRALPYAANGVFVALFTLAAGTALFGLDVSLSALPGILAAVLLAALSCAFLGLTLGALGLRLVDIWMVSNIAYALLLILTGVNVPSTALPFWLRTLGRFVPVTHAAEAARAATSGGAVVGPLAAEAALCLGFAALAALLLRVFERAGRASGALETI
ncbi:MULTISPECIES: ABC transporter permease [unclassified Streptomyces]|uniref:ABC transporter permease n=1 Tax=unclassified Streptomyces TaxID=2593676 RepID=UPI00190D5F02|nr:MULTISPECIES: ABC transporter permease [unclassified Streptomyces]MBK3569766.1 ABC transporter permease [Streptomyces sp. MBT62]MBK6015424.1 ABC transporter permease [Streptomyces sp. MBT53]